VNGDAGLDDDALPQPLTASEFGDGCSEARFEDWYRDHYERLRSLCARILSDSSAGEDIAQETLLRAWLGRERMREQDLGAWLSVVARNLCVSHMRRRWRAVPHEILPDVADYDADPALEAERSETRRSVRHALSQVGDRHRRLLVRREVGGADYSELGEELGLTASGARAVLFRARRSLRERLAGVGEGLGAWILGVRVRVGSVNRRARAALAPLESGAAPSLQAGIQLALAAGIALAGYGGAWGFGADASRGSPLIPAAAPASVLSNSFSAVAASDTVTDRSESVGIKDGPGRILPGAPAAAPVEPKWKVDPTPGGDTVLCLRVDGPVDNYCTGNYFAESGHSIIWDDHINPKIAAACEAVAVCEY
jgi:RNA polymerase sigma-70 factor (ECF subfamily)